MVANEESSLTMGQNKISYIHNDKIIEDLAQFSGIAGRWIHPSGSYDASKIPHHGFRDLKHPTTVEHT